LGYLLHIAIIEEFNENIGRIIDENSSAAKRLWSYIQSHRKDYYDLSKWMEWYIIIV